MRRIVKTVGSGIGLASEAIHHHKESKSRSPAARDRSPLATDKRPDVGPPQYLEGDEDLDSSDSDVEDENDWELDEAAEEARDKKDPAQGIEREMTVDELVEKFAFHHPPPAYSPPLGRLQAPVVLPQKRPQSKSRGFVRAYAPMLADCGIDQATFLEFLDDFDQSTHASQYITVINIAAGIAGFVPGPITMAVSISVQVAAGTAKELQTRHRTNTFLDQMNNRLFRPHGLYCMLMTFKPDKESSGEPVMLTSMISRSITPADSKFKEQLKLLKLTSGTTKGEFELPEAAPLVYPALDALPEDGEKQNALKRSSDFVASYMDKRAQATYAYRNPNSKLAVPEAPKFVSRYSDPNHPANSGSIISLVTGGHINPAGRKRERKVARRDRRRQRRGQAPMTEAEKRRPKKGIIGRILTQDVIYMMIVNMPSEEEMAAARGAAGIQAEEVEMKG